MFLAAGSFPRSFQPSLMPRSSLDQGIITGTAVVATYAIANSLHDLIEAAGAWASNYSSHHSRSRLRATGAVNAAAVALGVGVQLLLRPRKHERLGRGILRVAGRYIAWTGFAGVSVVALQEVLDRLDRRSGGRYNLVALPVAVPAGAALSAGIELVRHRRALAARPHTGSDDASQAVGRALLMGAGVGSALVAVASAERAGAFGVQRVIGRVAPGLQPAARPIGHALALGTLLAAGFGGVHYLYTRIETGAARPEAGFDRPPESALASGGPGSAVAFDNLTQYPRRHVLTYLRPDWIRQVMGEEPRAEPIRIYVGLDSAASVTERVELALREIERTAALDRSLLLLISPTGTGWVDPNIVEAVEYLTRGDVASVVMQYSKRPSPLSLNRVALGRAQNSMLWSAIHQRLYERPPERRPRVVIFGESLGAHSSQDVFLHQGTSGLRALGVDAALWLGTPYASEWKAEVLDGRRPDVDPALIGVFDHYEQLEQLPGEQREKLRYIMLTHENDAVGYFGVDLLCRRPDWLGNERPAAVPPETTWYPIVTFLQTAIDMKNAMNVVPGTFEARGHDYRADTARFVRAAFRLDATDEQLAKVEQALRRMELIESKWVEMHTPPAE